MLILCQYCALLITPFARRGFTNENKCNLQDLPYRCRNYRECCPLYRALRVKLNEKNFFFREMRYHRTHPIAEYVFHVFPLTVSYHRDRSMETGNTRTHTTSLEYYYTQTGE